MKLQSNHCASFMNKNWLYFVQTWNLLSKLPIKALDTHYLKIFKEITDKHPEDNLKKMNHKKMFSWEAEAEKKAHKMAAKHPQSVTSSCPKVTALKRGAHSHPLLHVECLSYLPPPQSFIFPKLSTSFLSSLHSLVLRFYNFLDWLGVTTAAYHFFFLNVPFNTPPPSLYGKTLNVRVGVL